MQANFTFHFFSSILCNIEKWMHKKFCIMRSEHLLFSKLQQWKSNNSMIEHTYMYMYSCSFTCSPVPYSCCCCVTHRCPVSWCVWGAKAVLYAHITRWSLSACGSGRVVLLFSHHLVLSLETEGPSAEVRILKHTRYSAMFKGLFWWCMYLSLYVYKHFSIILSNRYHYNVYYVLATFEQPNCSNLRYTCALYNMSCCCCCCCLMLVILVILFSYDCYSTCRQLTPEQCRIVHHPIGPGDVVKVVAFAGFQSLPFTFPLSLLLSFLPLSLTSSLLSL